VTTTESLLEEPELVYCDSQSVRLKFIQKEARHFLWKVGISVVAEEYISKVEISGSAPNNEKQVVVVFIPNLHCFIHSKFFGFSSFCIYFCICSPRNQAQHHFHLLLLSQTFFTSSCYCCRTAIANMRMIWDSAADAKVWLSSIFNDG
jgi:hypothetical protein